MVESKQMTSVISSVPNSTLTLPLATVATYSSTSSFITYSNNVGIGNYVINSGTGGYLGSVASIGSGKLKLSGGTYELEDGTKLIVDDKGNFKIEDKNAKITYKSNNVREFNKFINSSDLLADFIADMGKMGADADQVLDIPIQYFIRWLIFKSAEQDGEQSDETIPIIANDTVKVLEHNSNRCKCCGKYIPKMNLEHGLLFCNGKHADLFLERIRNVKA